jgi:hypothetical protein
MASTNTNPREYIPFQSLPKAKAYKILNYGRAYDKYTRFRISDNPEYITDIYVDNEPYITYNTANQSYNVEIHYAAELNKELKPCILTNEEIDVLVAKYGCKL